MSTATLIPAWQAHGACGKEPEHADDWFPPPGGGGLRTERALDICHTRCPVRLACLGFAMDREANGGYQRYGIFGGLGARERETLHRCRRGLCKHPHHIHHRTEGTTAP